MKDVFKGMLILGGVVLIFMYAMGGIDMGQQEVETKPEQQFVCESSTSNAVTFTMLDKYDSSEMQTGDFKVRKQGTETWATVSSGSSKSYAPGVTLEYLAGASEDEGYAKKGTVDVECKSEQTVEVMTADFIESSITGTYKNDLGQVNTAIDLNPGDSKNAEISFSGNYKTDYGNEKVGYNMLNCKVNDSEVDEFDISGLEKADGTPDVVDSVTGMEDYTYKYPVLESNDKKEHTISILADDTVDPVTDISCKIYDTNFDISGDTNNIIQGVEDEDGNNLGVDEDVLSASVTLAVN